MKLHASTSISYFSTAPLPEDVRTDYLLKANSNVLFRCRLSALQNEQCGALALVAFVAGCVGSAGRDRVRGRLGSRPVLQAVSSKQLFSWNGLLAGCGSGCAMQLRMHHCIMHGARAWPAASQQSAGEKQREGGYALSEDLL
jgi:hypothetical protein